MTNHLKSFGFIITVLLAAAGCSHSAPNIEEQAEKDIIVSNELSNKKVNTFEEDSFGHIWIGTFRGLNKFDVHNYHQYICTDDSLGLPDNQITDLHRDSKGKLWIASVNGVCVYTNKGNFKRFRILDKNQNISQILETSDGGLLFKSTTALSILNQEEGCIKPVIKNFFPGNFHISADGKLWYAGMFKLLSYNPHSFLPIDSLATQIPAYHSCMMPNDELWLSGLGKISIFDTKTLEHKDLPNAIKEKERLMQGDVDQIFSVDENSILLGTINSGMFYYYRPAEKVSAQDEPGFPFEIPSRRIRTIFRDSSHNIWFGTEDDGYSVSYRYKDQFNKNHYQTSFFKGKSVLSVCTDLQGRLWVSTLDDGLFVCSKDGNKILNVDVSHLLEKDAVGYREVRKVFADSKGGIWLLFEGKWRAIRCSFDGQSLHKERDLFIYTPMSIAEDHSDNIWIGNALGIVYKYSDDTLTEVKPFGDDKSWTFISDLLPLKNGNILVAAFGRSISMINSSTSLPLETPGHISKKALDSCLTRSSFIPTQLLIDSAGDLWCGTVANGLIRYNSSEKTLGRVENVPCVDISAIQEDRQGNIWVSTMNGLGKFDRSTGRMLSYFDADGIGGNQFNDKSACILSDGTLVFGGTHGLTMFNPLDIPRKRTVPLVFEDLKVYNKLIRPGKGLPIEEELCHKPKITLSHKQRGFGISFAALDYSEFERIHYYYMMEGYDPVWVDAAYNNEAYYSNLPAGRYTFKVRITNNSRSINEIEESLSVKIRPSFWGGWWAILFYIFAGLGILLLIFHLLNLFMDEKRAKERAEAEKAQEKHLNDVQMAFFSNIAHEFRTPLTMISGPVSILESSPDIKGENRRLLDILKRSSAWMLTLINQFMDFGKIESSTLKLQVAETEVIEPLKNILDIFSVNAANKHISLLSRGLEDSFNMWVDEGKMTKIILNLLSNALKFTPVGGKVVLAFDVINREDAVKRFPLKNSDTDMLWAQFAISDTGPGIPDDLKEKIFERYYQLSGSEKGGYNYGTGIGLYYARALASIHHGYIKVWDKQSLVKDGTTGSIFVFVLPVSESSYKDDEKADGEEQQDILYPLAPPSLQRVEEVQNEGEEKKFILVVDDDIDVANYLKILLSPYYNVRCVYDADSALKAMEEEEPDLVLSDVIMPGKEGYQLCSEIKGNPSFSHIPVVLVTAKAGTENQVKGLKEGADAYVTKPFDPAYLLALLQSQFENREKLRAAISSSTLSEELPDDTLAPQDKAFMKDLYALMEEELGNSPLDITTVSGIMKMSRTKFYYKIKGLTGDNPSVFFRRYKLNRAAQLLLKGKYNMSEIADMTGFNSLSHFSTSFKKQFGVPPSEYIG